MKYLNLNWDDNKYEVSYQNKANGHLMKKRGAQVSVRTCIQNIRAVHAQLVLCHIGAFVNITGSLNFTYRYVILLTPYEHPLISRFWPHFFATEALRLEITKGQF